ncbi:MAG: hypothetical protein ACRC1K_08105, partial [Planctomycetia bacterium]
MKKHPKSKWRYESVPSDAVKLYRLCWQLEKWLRLMVYVELKADRPDWDASIREKVKTWPPSALDNDKRLHHMATYHQSVLSYLTFGELLRRHGCKSVSFRSRPVSYNTSRRAGFNTGRCIVQDEYQDPRGYSD